MNALSLGYGPSNLPAVSTHESILAHLPIPCQAPRLIGAAGFPFMHPPWNRSSRRISWFGILFRPASFSSASLQVRYMLRFPCSHTRSSLSSYRLPWLWSPWRWWLWRPVGLPRLWSPWPPHGRFPPLVSFRFPLPATLLYQGFFFFLLRQFPCRQACLKDIPNALPGWRASAFRGDHIILCVVQLSGYVV